MLENIWLPNTHMYSGNNEGGKQNSNADFGVNGVCMCGRIKNEIRVYKWSLFRVLQVFGEN